MPTPEEITRKAVELARYLTSPETLTPRQLSGAWDGCRMLLIRDGHGEQRVRLEIDGHEGGAELPAWGRGVEECCEALLVFALEILSLGPPVSDVVLLSSWVNEDAPDGSTTMEYLRDRVHYWRSRLALGEFDQVSEVGLVEAAHDLSIEERQHLLPQHQRALLLDAAALLLEGHAPLRFEAEKLRALALKALEEGR